MDWQHLVKLIHCNGGVLLNFGCVDLILFDNKTGDLNVMCTTVVKVNMYTCKMHKRKLYTLQDVK